MQANQTNEHLNRDELFASILTPILEYYFNIPNIDKIEKGLIIKDRFETVRNMQIIVYSNDHIPPHFHVKSKNGEINAKFKIENCEYISGKIENKDAKRIKAFYNDVKTQVVKDKLMAIWNKRNNE